MQQLRGMRAGVVVVGGEDMAEMAGMEGIEIAVPGMMIGLNVLNALHPTRVKVGLGTGLAQIVVTTVLRDEIPATGVAPSEVVEVEAEVLEVGGKRLE